MVFTYWSGIIKTNINISSGSAIWRGLCSNNLMKIEIEVSREQFDKLIRLIDNEPSLEALKQQLKNGQAFADDSQTGELPREGDNAIIKRME